MAFTRSGLERRFLALVRRAGLPRPSMNLFVEGYELDAYWPDERFAVELDTYDYHGTPAAFEADRVRQEDLKLAGIEMVRITGTRMDREPTVVMQSAPPASRAAPLARELPQTCKPADFVVSRPYVLEKTKSAAVSRGRWLGGGGS